MFIADRVLKSVECELKYIKFRSEVAFCCRNRDNKVSGA